MNVVGEYNGTANLMARYTHGLGLISHTSAAGSATFYDFDAIGSTVGMSNDRGAYSHTYDYLPFGSAGFIRSDGVFPYRIDVENDATATAPAQQVVITDQLDDALDATTFELTEISFGDQLIAVPPHSQYYQTTVRMNYNGQDFEVHIEAGLHSEAGQVFARFQSIDPNTSLPPDLLNGLLPPENGTGRGQGHVSYIVRPRAGLATGTEIKNIALITFDSQEIVATNQVDPHDPSKGTDQTKEALNTIDSGVPTSSVLPLPPLTTFRTFTVIWSGIDDSGGSGMAGYDVLVSDNDGPFALWLDSTIETSGLFTGAEGHTYAFYSVAADNVGNVEPAPEVADAMTTVDSLSDVASNQLDGNDDGIAGDGYAQ